MKKALAKVADDVDNIIRHNEFPESILPSYLKSAVLAYPNRGGKRLRPAITQWFCGLFSQRPEMAIYPACAIEIFHTWTLVHDDIIDNDSTRRGEDSAHTLLTKTATEKFGTEGDAAEHFGKSFAILAGDLQQAWVLSLLLSANGKSISSDITLSIIERLVNRLYPRLLSGEAIDVEFEHRSLEDISEEEILTMLKWKTGELLKFAAETGVIIGLNTTNYRLDSVKIAGEFAMAAGLGFQLQDDILGIYADEEELGKPVGNDLRERKVTLLIKKALELSNGEQKAFLMNCLGNAKLTKEDLSRARVIIRDCGALKAIEEMAKECIKEAKEALFQLPENSYRDLLEELADFLIQRRY